MVSIYKCDACQHGYVSMKMFPSLTSLIGVFASLHSQPVDPLVSVQVQFKCPHNTIIAYCDPDFNLQSLSSSPTPYNFYDIPLGNKGICIPYTNDCPNLPGGQPGSRNV